MSDGLQVVLQALHADPCDRTAWLALADCLEEQGDLQRAELARAAQRLRQWPHDPGHAAAQTRVQELLRAGVRPVVPELVNSIDMRFALIPPGRFLMGSPSEEEAHREDEAPQHEVAITHPFYLGVFPVTQGQYESLTGSNPSRFRRNGPDRETLSSIATEQLPVERVSWNDAVRYCERLTALPTEVLHGRVYRLPTEAEWEYACRAGTTTLYSWGQEGSSLLANFSGAQPVGGAEAGATVNRTTVVDAYLPNPWGLYDMHGNLREWCSDWFERDYYQISPRENPTGPESGSVRVLRSGSLGNYARDSRSANRFSGDPGSPNFNWGFRVVLEHAPKAPPARPRSRRKPGKQ